MARLSTSAIDRAAIRDTYLNQQWVLVPRMASRVQLSRFRDDVLSAPKKRVTVGSSKEYWTEYAINAKSALGVFLKSRPVFDLVRSAANQALSRRATIWAQSYQVGERIAWHRDSAGEIQFLLCVKAPGEDAGGRFCLRANKAEIALSLSDGDALLFKATALSHSTTRIVGSISGAPQRITAVARFFALADGEGVPS
jgi:hypothetical protein